MPPQHSHTSTCDYIEAVSSLVISRETLSFFVERYILIAESLVGMTDQHWASVLQLRSWLAVLVMLIIGHSSTSQYNVRVLFLQPFQHTCLEWVKTYTVQLLYTLKIFCLLALIDYSLASTDCLFELNK